MRQCTCHDPKNTPGVSPVQLTKSSLFWVLKSANLAIEIPDFHITPVHNLPSGLHGLGVCLGLDWFVRRYAIGSIDLVGPIGRHIPHLPCPRQRAGERERTAWSHAGTDGTNTVQIGNRSETIGA